jgi:hypothetical protein
MRRCFSGQNFAVLCAASAALALLLALPAARADEGMWTFDNPPMKQLKEKYGFEPAKEWLERVRLASVRFNDGGSGSFVSADGLVLTNHHVAAGQLQKLSTPDKNLLQTGFYARTLAEERKCPDLELNVLVSYQDVTARVRGGEKPGMSAGEALKARQAEMAQIARESEASTGLRSDVETLYNGGEYWLYRYRKYTDVRLVFAVEQQIAFFGGDPDNFTYPRHDLDFALVRVYENDRPLTTKHFLPWNPQGAEDGELVFVSGHPGSTDRQLTVRQLEVQRDVTFPMLLRSVKRWLRTLRDYSARGAEQARQANDRIFGLENAIKAWTGEYSGLLDKNLMAKKQAEEEDFRSKVAANPAWQKEYGSAWDEIARAEELRVTRAREARFRNLRGVRLPQLALQIVRYVAETKKPDGERLDGFHDAELESLKFRMFSPAPVYPEMEEAVLADQLQESLDELGASDEFVKAALNGRKPAEVAKEVIRGTKLADPAFRKQIVESGEAGVAASTDPLVALARKVDPIGREMRKWLETHVEGVETAAGQKLGLARFAVYGKSAYPDATFTLRLSYGAVKGYPMNGTKAPPFTTLHGLYDRSLGFDGKAPYNLPPRFSERKDRLELATRLNFVTTNDVVGGNSGSPVINRKAELVGLVFDGNIESLVGTYVYDETTNRAVCVHAAAMIEALRKVYDAGPIADELLGKGMRR